jgi:hypothetical protein
MWPQSGKALRALQNRCEALLRKILYALKQGATMYIG